MGWIFFLVAAILFFLAGVQSPLIPNPVTWGLFAMALGLVLGGSIPIHRWYGGPPP